MNIMKSCVWLTLCQQQWRAPKYEKRRNFGEFALFALEAKMWHSFSIKMVWFNFLFLNVLYKVNIFYFYKIASNLTFSTNVVKLVFVHQKTTRYCKKQTKMQLWIQKMTSTVPFDGKSFQFPHSMKKTFSTQCRKNKSIVKVHRVNNPTLE